MTPRDVLRREFFGAAYYSFASRDFRLVPRMEAELLFGATREPVRGFWERVGDQLNIDRRAFGALVREWTRAGMLDATGRSRARVLELPAPKRTLSAPLLTQVQVTHHCNLSCRHCFIHRTGPKAPRMSLRLLDRLFSELSAIGALPVMITGGEPLVRPDFWELEGSMRRHGLAGRLNTNATLVDARVARRLARSVFREYSISLDGPDAATHDAVRGQGSFEKACAGIRALAKAEAGKIRLRVTVSRFNVDKLAGFGPLARKLGAHEVGFRPLQPTGAASDLGDVEVSFPECQRAYHEATKRWPRRAPKGVFSLGELNHPPDWAPFVPQFGCMGGTGKVTINEDGTVVACGSVLSQRDWKLQDHSFREIWLDSPTLKPWRRLTPNPTCAKCPVLSTCHGACRAIAYARGNGLCGVDSWSCANPEAREW